MRYTLSILARDIMLVEQLKNMQKVSSDYYNDVIYELLRRPRASPPSRVSTICPNW